RTKCTLFLPENLRLLLEMRLLFFSPAILCWRRATSLTSCVIPATPRITISSYFHLRGSRSSSWRRPFLHLTMPLLQQSRRQGRFRMFTNWPPALGSFSVNSCANVNPSRHLIALRRHL